MCFAAGLGHTLKCPGRTWSGRLQAPTYRRLLVSLMQRVNCARAAPVFLSLSLDRRGRARVCRHGRSRKAMWSRRSWTVEMPTDDRQQDAQWLRCLRRCVVSARRHARRSGVSKISKHNGLLLAVLSAPSSLGVFESNAKKHFFLPHIGGLHREGKPSKMLSLHTCTPCHASCGRQSQSLTTARKAASRSRGKSISTLTGLPNAVSSSLSIHRLHPLGHFLRVHLTPTPSRHPSILWLPCSALPYPYEKMCCLRHFFVGTREMDT
ncbi:hypothetical protein IWZ00DRAFT_133268 [Phyllosticta capitalensis]